MQYLKVILSLVLALCGLIPEIEGHGMMLSPAGRSSRWRFDGKAIKNYDDNGLYCGGFWKQTANGNRCGLCGDDWSLSEPRPNELGGRYGQGVIVKTFTATEEAEIDVQITANHLGHFSFHLCDLDMNGSESEDCFNKHPLKFKDGSYKYNIGSRTGPIKTIIQWPSGVKCQHCVLRWTYKTGNNWGVCEDGTGALGCGEQETFKNCADISVLGSARSVIQNSVQNELPLEVKKDA